MLLIDMVETQLFIPGLIQGYQQWRANWRYIQHQPVFYGCDYD